MVSIGSFAPYCARGIILESIAFLLTSLEQESKDISIRYSRRIFLGGEEEEHTLSPFF